MNPSKQLNLAPKLMKMCYDLLHPLENSKQQNIIAFIHANIEASVTQIFTTLHLTQPQASHFLADLRKGRYVTTMQRGKEIYYALNYERFEEIDGLIKALNINIILPNTTDTNIY